MSSIVTDEGCFNCQRSWHHACEHHDCRVCHGATEADATPKAEPYVPPQQPELVEPSPGRFLEMVHTSVYLARALTGEDAAETALVRCPNHGYRTNDAVVCIRCNARYPISLFLQPEQQEPTEGIALERVPSELCECGLRYIRVRCPDCEAIE